MASTRVPPFSTVTITVSNGNKLATYSAGSYRVDNLNTYANEPAALVNSFAGSGGNTTTAYGADTTVQITAGAENVHYNQGATPSVPERGNYQTTPGTLNATGTLTAALILGGIVTTTTAAGVTATLDTGTVMDAALSMNVDDSFDWTVINTGGNTFTVTASSQHTCVGVMTVATNSQRRFRTRKTAAATFVTYALS